MPLLLLQTGQAQGTTAGTDISNQVAMGFEIASIPQQTLSNIDVFTVQGLIDVSGTGTAENLLITDNIPTNTRYTPSSITLDSSTLTDAPGDDPGSFSGNLVSVDLGNTSGPANFVITLDVTIN